MSEGELLFPRWVASVSRLGDGGAVLMVHGQGGDGGESWSSVAFVYASDRCSFEVIWKRSAAATCEFTQADPVCTGRRLRARMLDGRRAEVQESVFVDGEREKEEAPQAVDLGGLVSKLKRP